MLYNMCIKHYQNIFMEHIIYIYIYKQWYINIICMASSALQYLGIWRLLKVIRLGIVIYQTQQTVDYVLYS